jgi:D-alanyl-D-alanine carboxypeptidase (penicillin-binding protein 5/6)
MRRLSHRAARAIVCGAAALALALLSICALPPQALAQGELSTKAKNAILVDFESGAVVFQRGADELGYPASMSKLMTLAVLFKQMKDGKVKPEDEFLMSENAWRTGGAPSGTSAMFVPINTKATVSDLIQGIVVQSGNDACIAVAEALAGSEAKFAEMMTAEARRIGLPKSTFANSTGLHNPAQKMTARELAQLATYLIREYPEQYKVFAQREFPYRKHKFYNRNPLLSLDMGVDGLKTGHTSEAGYGLVASAVRDGRRLVAVVMGLANEKERREESKKIIDWGFNSSARFKLFDEGEQVGYARVWGGERFYVPLTGKGDLMVVLPKFPPNPKLRAEIVYQGPLKAPLKKGDQVAMLRVTTPNRAVSEAPLYVAEDIEPGGTLRRGVDTLAVLAVRWVTGLLDRD